MFPLNHILRSLILELKPKATNEEIEALLAKYDPVARDFVNTLMEWRK